MKDAKDSSSKRNFMVAGLVGLLVPGFLAWLGTTEASTFRVGIDYRTIEVTFEPTYYQDSYARTGYNEESADLFGIRGEFASNWAVSERSTLGVAPAFTFFFGGSWEEPGGDAYRPLSANLNLGGEISVPLEFIYKASEKVDVSGCLGVSYAYISIGEPEELYTSSDREYYKDGIDWQLIDLYFAPGVHYRLNETTGLVFRWRMTLTDIGGGVDYADEPEPTTLWSNGPQFLFEFGF